MEDVLAYSVKSKVVRQCHTILCRRSKDPTKSFYSLRISGSGCLPKFKETIA